MLDKEKWKGRTAECCLCKKKIGLLDAMRTWWRGQGKFWCRDCVKKS